MFFVPVGKIGTCMARQLFHLFTFLVIYILNVKHIYRMWAPKAELLKGILQFMVEYISSFIVLKSKIVLLRFNEIVFRVKLYTKTLKKVLDFPDTEYIVIFVFLNK